MGCTMGGGATRGRVCRVVASVAALYAGRSAITGVRQTIVSAHVTAEAPLKGAYGGPVAGAAHHW